jgi:hypothetical protein
VAPDSQPYYAALPEVAHAWGIVSDGLTLLRNGLNHVFAGTLVSGATVIIRITDDAHRAASLIQAELDWLSFLRPAWLHRDEAPA